MPHGRASGSSRSPRGARCVLSERGTDGDHASVAQDADLAVFVQRLIRGEHDLVARSDADDLALDIKFLLHRLDEHLDRESVVVVHLADGGEVLAIARSALKPGRLRVFLRELVVLPEDVVGDAGETAERVGQNANDRFAGLDLLHGNRLRVRNGSEEILEPFSPLRVAEHGIPPGHPAFDPSGSGSVGQTSFHNLHCCLTFVKVLLYFSQYPNTREATGNNFSLARW